MSGRLPEIRSGRVFEIVNYWQVLLVNPPLQKSITNDIMSDQLTIISRSGRVFEIVNYCQVLLVNPPYKNRGRSTGPDMTND